MQANLSVPVQGVHLCKEAVVFKVLLILVMPGLGLHTKLDQFKHGKNIIIYAGGNIGFTALFLSMLHL